MSGKEIEGEKGRSYEGQIDLRRPVIVVTISPDPVCHTYQVSVFILIATLKGGYFCHLHNTE